jgi:predicted component of type VI protein secretion system
MDATFSRENITDALTSLPNKTAACIARNIERLLNTSAIASNGEQVRRWGLLPCSHDLSMLFVHHAVLRRA